MDATRFRRKRRRLPTRRGPGTQAQNAAPTPEIDEGWSGLAFARIDPRTGRCLDGCGGLARLFGFPPDIFPGRNRPLTDLCLPESRPEVARWLELCVLGAPPQHCAFAFRDAAGQKRWAALRGALVRDAQGRTEAVRVLLADDTERHRLEDDLRESDRRHKLLSENLVDAIWAMDPDLRFTYLSPSAETLFGRPVERLLGMSLTELFTRESLRSIDEAARHWRGEAARAQEPVPVWLGLELLEADGGVLPVEVLARATLDAGRNVTGYCGTARDIRLRRRMERIEALLARLAKSLLECEDLSQTQELAAACAEALTGARRVVVARRGPDGAFLGPDGTPPPEGPDALTLAVTHAGEEMGRIVALDVPPRAAAEALPLLERVGALFALAATRLSAEEARRKNERLARKLLESMHEGVWALDHGQRSIFANERLAAMLGYPVSELLALRPPDLMPAPQREQALARIQEYRLGLTSSTDRELRRKDGGLLSVRLNTAPIFDENGAFDGLVCTIADLSDQRRMERKLRNNQARFEALYELSRLTGATEAQTAGFTLREALRLTGSRAGALFFVDAAADRLLPMAASPAGSACSGHPELPASGEGLWARVCASSAPFVVKGRLAVDGLPPDHPPVAGFLGVCARDGDVPAAVLGLTGKDGDYTPDDTLHVSLLLDGMWRMVRARRDETRIRASLREKEALLREVHHRVKNNLQVVSSLLDMAGRRLPDPEARQSMEEVRGKVLAMSLVHAQLHGDADQEGGPGRGIDLERYVRALFRQLREIYSGDMELSVNVLLDDLALGLDQAAPLGLALNEALANAFKHGRPQGPGGRAAGRVRLRAWREEDGDVRITVRDNGPGLPAGFEPERAAGLGLKLMSGLVRGQLRGEISLDDTGAGLCVSIRFCPNIVT